MAQVRRGKKVEVRDGNTLVIMLGAEPYVELRPAYSEGTGPIIEVYKVMRIEPQYLFTLRVDTVGSLVQKLPIVVSAARRLARSAAQADTKTTA